MTGARALAAAVQLLKAAGVDDPARDARRLLAHAARCAPDRLSLIIADEMSAALARTFDDLVRRRAARQPVSQLVGARDFYRHRFEVTPEVLDPRPETEVLVRLALQHPYRSVLDLGTGSGAILLSLLAENPQARGVGTDISAGALRVAARNARALGLADRAGWTLSDWFGAVAGRFDLIVSNPPYIAEAEMGGLAPELRDWEPRIALTDGADGLQAYRAIASGAAAHLSCGGRLLVEIGFSQGPAVCDLLTGAGFEGVTVHPDLDGRNRVVSARLAENGAEKAQNLRN